MVELVFLPIWFVTRVEMWFEAIARVACAPSVLVRSGSMPEVVTVGVIGRTWGAACLSCGREREEDEGRVLCIPGLEK